ncbi:MAG TPA: hypothetical protein VGM56_17775 [Byssovorax sp.]|jgi:hypothetical protein
MGARTNVLGVSFSALLVASSLVGCSSDSTTPVSTADCAPENQPLCTIGQQVISDCLALVDDSASQTPTLRMAQLILSQPLALAGGAVQDTVINGGVTLNLPSCQMGDSLPSSTYGNFNWLMQFDLAAKKLKTGGAHPELDPLTGYTFADEMITQGGHTFHIAPVELDLTLTNNADGSIGFDVTNGLDLTVPIYQDKQASTEILLPLHAARLTNGTLSPDHNCIGALDLANLTPDDSCKLPDPYLTAGTLDGFITLEEADSVEITMLNTTLCAVLAGAGGTTCSRTNGKIDYQGNWCEATNAAATANCSDAVQLEATFAAAAVKLNP